MRLLGFTTFLVIASFIIVLIFPSIKSTILNNVQNLINTENRSNPEEVRENSFSVSQAVTDDSVDNTEIPKQVEIPSDTSRIKLLNSLPDNYEIPLKPHIYQTFNNCGPATLSMLLSYYDLDVGQKELGEVMRPYQNSIGDNDDKSVFLSEFGTWAEYFGKKKYISALSRPNGDMDKLKLLLANDFPVVLKVWLNKKEDIGHFIIARGYNDDTQTLLFDDSYYGPNKQLTYADLLKLWQPFNYYYAVLYRTDQEVILKTIADEDFNEQSAWENMAERANIEKEINSNDIYSYFSLSVASYYLDQKSNSIKYFELVEDKLPRRMLWYQIEPILAYKDTGNTKRALELIDTILSGGNRAFSELYFIKGQIFLEQGDQKKAKAEFENAIKYKYNYEAALEELKKLQ